MTESLFEAERSMQPSRDDVLGAIVTLRAWIADDRAGFDALMTFCRALGFASDDPNPGIADHSLEGTDA